MRKSPGEVAQWTLDVTVFHGPGFGHRLRASVLGRHGDWHTVGTWSWQGIGIPESLVPDIEARVTAVITEHLLTRYGFRQELPFPPGGHPGAR